MKVPGIVVPLAAILMLTGCVTSRQARHVTPGSFLGESAALLQRGDQTEDALLVYRKSGTDWARYDKVVLDPVQIWSAAPDRIPKDQADDLQRVVDSFHLTFREKLARSYEIVEAPAPGAMRMSMAIVNGSQANQTLKVAKLIAPWYATAADVLWTFITGKPAFAGEVSLEYMIRDANTNELLEAGADRRVGGNQIGKATFTTWGDVKNILTYWSDARVYRLCVDRRASDCRRPAAGITQPGGVE